MQKFTFFKVANKWLVDLPTWTGSLEDLQMVAGADTFLDEMAHGNSVVSIELSILPVDNAQYVLIKQIEDSIGGTYRANNINYTIWLCNVTKFVFGCHPDTIYICNITSK
jgi:hypothetical protein